MEIEQPVMLEIKKIVDEAKDLKTFIFRYKLSAKPGQFVIVWLPRVDEKPFSISFQDNDRFGITVFKVGPFTEKLFKLRVGDKVGIRGPYGNGFSLRRKRVVLVGGGCGTAPLGFLADELKKKNVDIHYIIGARNKECLLFEKRMKIAGIKTYFATDDGSYGFKGYTTDLLKEIISKHRVDKVYTCGPEIMMKFVVDICDKAGLPCELSLERMLKCSMGICGSCSLDPTGWRVCKDGPVFTGEQIKKVTEFCSYKRDFSGKKIKL